MKRDLTQSERVLWRAVTRDIRRQRSGRAGAPLPGTADGGREAAETSPANKSPANRSSLREQSAGTPSTGKSLAGKSSTGKPLAGRAVFARLPCDARSAGAASSHLSSAVSPAARPASPIPHAHAPKSKPAPMVRFDDPARARKVARGVIAIDGRLDLHGLTQTEALDALAGCLHRARERGYGCVLVITGKGVISQNGDVAGRARGVLRRQLPFWVQSNFRDIVSAVMPAHAKHGGAGAFYLFLRRKK